MTQSYNNLPSSLLIHYASNIKNEPGLRLDQINVISKKMILHIYFSTEKHQSGVAGRRQVFVRPFLQLSLYSHFLQLYRVYVLNVDSYQKQIQFYKEEWPTDVLDLSTTPSFIWNAKCFHTGDFRAAGGSLCSILSAIFVYITVSYQLSTFYFVNGM